MPSGQWWQVVFGSYRGATRGKISLKVRNVVCFSAGQLSDGNSKVVDIEFEWAAWFWFHMIKIIGNGHSFDNSHDCRAMQIIFDSDVGMGNTHCVELHDSSLFRRGCIYHCGGREMQWYLIVIAQKKLRDNCGIQVQAAQDL